MTGKDQAPAVRGGLFVTLEGCDGCGKTTQLGLLQGALVREGYDVLCLREPGGTPISEAIRALLLDPAHAEMAPECELLLFEASRAQLVRERIEPALAAGQVVLCDRFYDSTTAYQMAARGLDAEQVHRANELGSCGVTPDLTLVLDLDPGVALARATGSGADRMEGEGTAFQAKVRAAFLDLAEREPQRVRLVDADVAPAKVHERVLGLVHAALASRATEGARP